VAVCGACKYSYNNNNNNNMQPFTHDDSIPGESFGAVKFWANSSESPFVAGQSGSSPLATRDLTSLSA
jgi:hypothetical protein